MPYPTTPTTLYDWIKALRRGAATQWLAGAGAQRGNFDAPAYSQEQKYLYPNNRGAATPAGDRCPSPP